MDLPPQMGIVTLGVSDLGRSEEFYSALGWRRAKSSVPGEITWFETTHSWIGLFGRDELAEDAGVPPTSTVGFSGVTLAINLESPEAVDRGIAAAVKAGATVTQPAAYLDWGGYRGYFTDPDGYLWEVAHNPGFPIDSDGRVIIP